MIIKPQMLLSVIIVTSFTLLFHCFDVVLLVGVLPSSLKLMKFLVQQPIEQFQILQTSLDLAVFPEPNFSSAD